jgi:hypothetical protein
VEIRQLEYFWVVMRVGSCSCSSGCAAVPRPCAAPETSREQIHRDEVGQEGT